MLTMKEAKRLSILEQLIKNQLTIGAAAKELNLSPRQIKRLKKRYHIEAEQAVFSKRKGRPNCRKIAKEIEERAIAALKAPLYEGFGPTFAMEQLALSHGIRVSAETVRKWMIAHGLWKPKSRKEKRIYQRRTRRSRFGELLQGDGSPHDWFEGRADKCSLLQFVDDATSTITAAKFFKTETTEGYLEVLEQQLKGHGKPQGLYVDKHSVFRVNREEVKSGTCETHFGKVVRELNIELIFANSPQAKGRVERANSTLQDRLVKEMRLRGISSIEEANAFLPEFIEDYNNRFGKTPQKPKDAHRPYQEQEIIEEIFARKAKRKLSKNLSFQYKGTLYQIETNAPNRIRKTHVDIIERRDQSIKVEIGGISYGYTKWEDIAYKRPKSLDAKELEARWSIPGHEKPQKHHPWR